MVKESGLHEPDKLFYFLKIADKYLKNFDSFDEFTINLTQEEHLDGLFKYLKHNSSFDYVLQYHNWLIQNGEDKFANFVENVIKEIELFDLKLVLIFRKKKQDLEMFEPKLTDEMVFVAKLMLSQAKIKDCDCDTPCNCLVIQKVLMDVDSTVIKTKNKTYLLNINED